MKWVTRLFLIISLLAYGSVAFAADLELRISAGKKSPSIIWQLPLTM